MKLHVLDFSVVSYPHLVHRAHLWAGSRCASQYKVGDFTELYLTPFYAVDVGRVGDHERD